MRNDILFQETQQQQQQQQQQLLHDVQDRATELMRNCAREFEVLGGGITKGIWDSAQNRLQRDPLGVLQDTATAISTGAALACAVESAPILAIGVSTIGAANMLWATLDPSKHAVRNATLSHAWQNTWHSSNTNNMNYYANKVAQDVGPEAFDLMLSTGFGAGGFSTAKLKISSIKARINDTGHYRLPSHHSGEINQSSWQSPFGSNTGRQSNDSMKDFIQGNPHAFEKGRIGLRPERHVRYENVTRRPRQVQQSPMSEHTSFGKSKQFTQLAHELRF